MDKIEKALAKLNAKERAQIKDVLVKIRSAQFSGLDLKKLRGREDIFRVRKGNIRIIYRVVKEQIFILAIERRNERTYKL